jgi:hypothetical protein
MGSHWLLVKGGVLRFKGGLINGTLAAVYGTLTMWILFYQEAADMAGMDHSNMEGMNGHQTMQRISYVMGGIGIILALYFLATREVMGIPVFLVGLTHFGLARYSDHVGLQVGAAAMAIVMLMVGVTMLSRVQGETLRE